LYSAGAPCAYFKRGRCVSPLTRHSWAVHDAAVLAAGRLLGPPRVLPGRAWLATALRVAAVYHDLGKAAESFQREGRSFRLHEHVGALILWMAAEKASREGNKGLAAVLMVAAGAVARHHAAMQGRHPVEIAESSKDLQDIVELAKQIPPGTPSLLAQGYISTVIEEALAEARSEIDMRRARHIIEAIKDMRYYDWDLLLDTMMVTGTIIVADILVSSIQRSDRVTKSYARSWMRELSINQRRLNKLIAAVNRPTLP